jgi:hypothetical protein
MLQGVRGSTILFADPPGRDVGNIFAKAFVDGHPHVHRFERPTPPEQSITRAHSLPAIRCPGLFCAGQHSAQGRSAYKEEDGGIEALNAHERCVTRVSSVLRRVSSELSG